jgi:putative FmdB family regulatory protein
MPIYDYKCSNCGQEFELIQKFSDKPKTYVQIAKKILLLSLISAPSFRLKGGGWYETDFKTGKKKNLGIKEQRIS